MANNLFPNKVQLADGTVLIDLSNDTVTEDKLLSGVIAHDKSGRVITGTYTIDDVIQYSYDGTKAKLTITYL